MYFISISENIHSYIAEYSFIIFHHFTQCQYSTMYFLSYNMFSEYRYLLVLYLRTMEKVSRCFASEMNQHYLLRKMQTYRLSRFCVRQSYVYVYTSTFVFFPRNDADNEEYFVIIVGREIAVHCI